MKRQIPSSYKAPTPLFTKATKLLAQGLAREVGPTTVEWLVKALNVAATARGQARDILERAITSQVLMTLAAAENLTDDQRAQIALLTSSTLTIAAVMSTAMNVPALSSPKLGFDDYEFLPPDGAPIASDRDLLRDPDLEVRALAEAHFADEKTETHGPGLVDTSALSNLKPAAE